MGSTMADNECPKIVFMPHSIPCVMPKVPKQTHDYSYLTKGSKMTNVRQQTLSVLPTGMDVYREAWRFGEAVK